MRGRESEGKQASAMRLSGARPGLNLDLEALARATRAPAIEAAARYSCQATSLLEATTPLRWWDLRQYVMDIVSRNVGLRDFLRYVGIAAFNIVMRRIRFERRHAYPSYPYVPGLAERETPQRCFICSQERLSVCARGMRSCAPSMRNGRTAGFRSTSRWSRSAARPIEFFAGWKK